MMEGGREGGMAVAICWTVYSALVWLSGALVVYEAVQYKHKFKSLTLL